MTTKNIPQHLQHYVLDMAALKGEMICQGHADVCAILGHGSNRRDGIEQGTCPRCGEVTGRTATFMVKYVLEDDSTPTFNWDTAVARAINAGAGTVLIAITDDGTTCGARKAWVVSRDAMLHELYSD